MTEHPVFLPPVLPSPVRVRKWAEFSKQCVRVITSLNFGVLLMRGIDVRYGEAALLLCDRAVVRIDQGFGPVGSQTIAEFMDDTSDHEERYKIFISLSGFSESAVRFSYENQCFLIEMDHQGRIAPANNFTTQLIVMGLFGFNYAQSLDGDEFTEYMSQFS